MKQYDVIIIGGGLGGLSCGVMLAKEGLGVCVLEQHSVIGGCLQSFHRNGRTLDTGMHYVGSLSEGQIMHQYFKYLGIMDSLQLQKLDENGFDHFHFPDGKSYSHAMGHERFAEALSEQFPEEREAIKSFTGLLKSFSNLISKDALKEGKISRGGIELLSVSAYSEIEKYFKDERLKSVIAGNCALFAGDKLTTSLYEYGMITNSNIEGAYAFSGGSQQVADLLTDEIKKHGGDVVLNAKVSKIHLEGDKAEYLELSSGERFYSKWIISSLHPSVTFSLLENNTVYKKAFFTRINSLPNTYGIFTTYLLLKPNTVKNLNQNHYVFSSPDVWSAEADYSKCEISSLMMSMQPNPNSEYTDVVTLLVPMHFSFCQQWANSTIGCRGEAYKEFKQRYAEASIELISKHFPYIKENIEKVYTASPLTYRDYTATPEGSAYGIVKDCRNPIVTLMPAQTRISNLLLTGQNLNIHGCLGTTISSAVTCSEILGTEYLSKKIGNA